MQKPSPNRPADPNEREQADRYPWEDEKPKIVSAPTVTGRGSAIREDLRRLPSEYVTTDVDDPGKVHALDPGHVRDTIAEERFAEDQASKDPAAPAAPPWRPVRQDLVDLIGLSATKQLLITASGELESGRPTGLRVYHLWFPKNDIRVYALRRGNPPPDSERPAHLRGIDLVVDPCVLKPRVLETIKKDPERLAEFRGAVSDGIADVVKQQMHRLGLIV